MKLDSAYKRAMDAVRPAPERRDAMLQAILNHKEKLAANRRWALGAVPAAAVAVLALALVWGGGALAPGKTAAPDVVTQAAAVATLIKTRSAQTPSTPTPNQTHPAEPQDIAQELTNLSLSSHTNQPDGLPWMVPLLRTTPIELTDGQLQAVAQRLRDKGWKNIAVQKHGDGSYTIRTDGDTSSQPALSDDENREQARHFMQDSGLAELLRQQGMPVALQPADGSGTALYRGLNHGYATPGFVRLNLERGKAVDECLIYATRSQMLYELTRLALEQAAAQAFYFPTEGDRVQPDTALEATSVRLAYADALPIYEFHAPIPGTKGMVTAYAPAVDEAVLQANEELRRTLERFRTGQLAITGYAGTSQRLPYLKVFPPEGELTVELDDEIAAHMEELFREDWNTIITAAQSSPKYTAEERFYSDTNIWVFWQHLEDQYGASDHGYRILRNELGERALARDSRADSPIATELCDYLLGVVNGLNTGFSYVDRSDVRDITGARLVTKDGRTVELIDKVKLRQLEKRLQEAQPLGYRPQTYEQAARVELTLAKGPTVTVMMDGLNDFYWLGSGCFYNYGPDTNGRDSMDATTPNGTGELLALFGLKGWE